MDSPNFWTNQILLEAKFGRAEKRTKTVIGKTDEKRKLPSKNPTPVLQIVIFSEQQAQTLNSKPLLLNPELFILNPIPETRNSKP
jgi:hypothetical protein